MNIQEIREKYPQYEALSDQDLADRLHQKFYPDMAVDDFYGRIGYQPKAQVPTDAPGGGESFLRGLGDPLVGLAQLSTRGNMMPMLPGPLGTAFHAGRDLVGQAMGAPSLAEQRSSLDEAIAQSEQAYQERRGEDAGIDWSRIGGNVVNPVNWAPALRMAGPMMRTGMGGRMGLAALEGGTRPGGAEEGSRTSLLRLGRRRWGPVGAVAVGPPNAHGGGLFRLDGRRRR